MPLVSSATRAHNVTATGSSSHRPPGFNRGLNISHLLSQIPRQAPFGRPDSPLLRDFDWVRDRYDHIRLPVDGRRLLSREGVWNQPNLAVLDDVLQSALDRGLGVVLDLHEFHGTSFSGDIQKSLFTVPEERALALRFWQSISERYTSVGPALRFELLNEPVADEDGLLNRFYEPLLQAVRSVSPKRSVILCSNRWGKVATVRSLEPFLDDPHVILSFHYYDPHIFTHQKASWVKNDHPEFPSIPFPGRVPDLNGVVAPGHYGLKSSGKDLTIEAIEEDLSGIAAWARAKGATLYMGEFGVYEKAPTESRIRWTETVLACCRQSGIPWAIWDYAGSFAVRDPESGAPTAIQVTVDRFQ